MTSEPADREGGPPAVRRIGRYQIEAVLGVGAFATVYRAVDERLEDTVAVKVLAENHSLDPEMRKRFLTEGRVLRRIESPHVIDVHDLGETDQQQPYLVLEHAERGTLARRALDLRARGWRPAVWDLWAVAAPLARALDAVHRVEVVHRDLNPGNVLLSARGAPERTWPTAVVRHDERLVVADLGLCKDLALNSGHTSAGGTEGFRPPELRHGPAIIDGRADLWSLSALMVWLATGAPPDEEPVEAAVVGAGLPVGLAWALNRSLAEDPRARHPDPLSWLADFEAALRQPWSPPAAGFVQAGSPPAAGFVQAGSPPTAGFVQAGRAGEAGFVQAGSPHAAHPHREPWAYQVVPWSSPQLAQPPHVGAAASGRPVVADSPATPLPGWGWQLRHSVWLVAALPFGLTTWAGFLAIGLRAERRAWLWTAGAYGCAAVAFLALILTAPADADGKLDPDTWQSNVGTAVMVVLWIGGFVHALVVNGQWLRWCRYTAERYRAT